NQAGVCDPVAQPFPHFGEKDGRCLKSCGALGGNRAPATSCASNGFDDVGTAYDVTFCCRTRTTTTPSPTPTPTSTPPPTCNPVTQPSPHWGVKNGQCVKSCGALGGQFAPASACSNFGYVDVGVAYDVPFCCKAGTTPPPAPPTCDPVTQPSPHWGIKNGQCLKSCGALGGNAAPPNVCSSIGAVDVGVAYDVAFCCKI